MAKRYQYQEFSSGLTLLLNEMSGGDEEALNQAQKILEEFVKRQLIEPKLSSADKVLLQATAVIDDLWMQVFNSNKEWVDRRHFFANATDIVKHLVIGEVRRRKAGKRAANFVDLDKIDPEDGSLSVEELVSLEESLRKLEALHPDLAEAIQQRFYYRKSIQEIGELLGIDQGNASKRISKALVILKTYMQLD